MNIYPVSSLKRYGTLLESVKRGHHAILTKNKRMQYAILPYDEYENWVQKNFTKEIENYYFVDYENVGPAHISDIVNKILSNSEVFIFYSKSCLNIPIDVMLNLQNENNIKYKFLKVDVGTKNSLDFQLSSYLGYIIHESSKKILEKDINYYIVANDKGYDCLIPFYEKMGIQINKINFKIKTLEPFQAESKTNTQKVINQKQFSKVTETEILKYISDEIEATYITDIFNCSNTKQQMHNSLMNYFKDGTKVKKIYRDLLPLMNEKGKK